MITVRKVKADEEQTSIKKEEIIKLLGNEKVIKLYRNMVRTRAFDEKLNELLQKGIHVHQHSSIGQEATANAACLTLNEEDYIMPYHRGWAWAIGKGMDTSKMMAEVMHRKTGYCKGHGGPHLADYKLGVLGRSGVQAAHIGIGTGVALSAKMRNSGQVVLCFFGNGASNAGYFHEALNMAATWKAPIVFYCENNLYEIFSHIKDTTAIEDIAYRALGYGMPGVVVDGNDALAVYQVAYEATMRARTGAGPTLVETKTYRWEGHSTNDTIYYGGYRTKEEVDEWKKRCPISRLAEDLVNYRILDKTGIEEIHRQAKEEMDKAAEYAQNCPYPEPADYLEDVYAD